MTHFSQALRILEDLKENPIAIRRVKEKANQIILFLQKNPQANLDQVIRELEELSASEIPSYDRTLLWDVISFLESLRASTKL